MLVFQLLFKIFKQTKLYVRILSTSLQRCAEFHLTVPMFSKRMRFQTQQPRDFNMFTNITVTINTTKQPQYLPKISDVSATTVAFFEVITLSAESYQFEKGDSCSRNVTNFR